MKKLQNNFTTIEQSKRLLEIGIPADSADCIYVRFSKKDKFSRKFRENVLSENPYEYLDFYYPCWSVGRLIEIYGILRGVTCIFSLETTDIIDNIIDCFNRNKLDFFKLEE